MSDRMVSVSPGQRYSHPDTGYGDQSPTSQPETTGSFSLAYVDFVPSLVRPRSFTKSAIYERFDVLVHRANGWLQSNPKVRVKTVESIDVKAASSNDNDVNNNSSFFTDNGSRNTFYNRYLRMWIVPEGPEDSVGPQQIGYYNIIPACTSPTGIFSDPKFESFNITIERANQMFRQTPLEGRIINMETVDVEFVDYKGFIDPDDTYWTDSGYFRTYFVNVIRIFYETGPPAMEEIGCTDFVPEVVEKGGALSQNTYEPLSQCAIRADKWMKQKQGMGLRITNIHSIDYRVDHEWGGTESVDTMRSMFRGFPDRITRYLKILRVCYAKSFGEISNSAPVTTLTYRSFMPVQLTLAGMLSAPKFELQAENLKRIQAWCSVTGAKIFSCESVQVKMKRNQKSGPEVTYNQLQPNTVENKQIALRIYLDGVYNDPPPDTLPLVPQAEQGGHGSCSIL